MPRRKMGGASRIRGGRPGARPRGVTRRPAVTRSPRRSSSPKRAQTRRAKRVQHHRKAAKINTRSRPAVRPARVARKRMPSAKLRQTSRPAVRPAAGFASFYLAANEVTQADYENLVGSNPSHQSGDQKRADPGCWYCGGSCGSQSVDAVEHIGGTSIDRLPGQYAAVNH